MNIFAIETSCDETSASVVSDGVCIKSLIISSQIKIHEEFFGVVPELASRAHTENINIVIKKALHDAGIYFKNFCNDIDAIAFTVGPGLSGSLIVGSIAAKSLSYVFKKPLIPINHIEGHLYSSFINNEFINPPFLGLIISGGHTEIIIVEKIGKYKILGETRDDAIGEAFDKVARMLGLPYPGGPIIDEKSYYGNSKSIFFTRPYLKGSWDFSFSGIKTAVLNYIKKNPIKSEKHLNDICSSFNQAVAETIVYKSFKAVKEFKLKQIVLGGGVSNNSLIRKMFIDNGLKHCIKIFLPNKIYCTDNAAMIGCVAYLKQKKCGTIYSNKQLKINPSLSLENWH
jgi:N6-L-threonylcarbamoyladenine synthase